MTGMTMIVMITGIFVDMKIVEKLGSRVRGDRSWRIHESGDIYWTGTLLSDNMTRRCGCGETFWWP